MARVSDQVTALLDEMDAIDQLAASLQTGSPSQAKAPPAEQVTRLRELYLDWYARSLKVFNEATRQSFQRHYSGGGSNIHRYISDPASTGYSPASSVGSSRRGAFH